MKWSDIGEQLLAFGAPLLGTAIGGPAGGLVGKMIADEFGGEATPENVSKVIQMAGPDQITKFESERRLKLIELANADREDARSREVAIIKATGKRDWVQAAIALIMILGFFLMVGALLFAPVPEDNQRVLDLVSGAMIGSVSSVVSYYFGASTKRA